MERKLYEKNAHIYPYTLWEEFDEFKQKEYLEQLKKSELKELEKPKGLEFIEKSDGKKTV
jgi:hypothetical protein